MQFRVLGVRENGDVDALVIDAPTALAARTDGAQRGIAVIDVAPVRGARLGASGQQRAAKLDVALFCQELLALLAAGITVGEALDALSRKDDDAAGAHAARHLLLSVREGQPLSVAMARRPELFPPLLTESMRASERTSDYVPALTRYIQYQRLGTELRGKALSAALYPMILLAVSGAVLLFLIGYVVPRFAQVYAEMGDRLPLMSRLLLGVGQGIAGHPLLAGTVLAAVAVGMLVLLRSSAARRRALAWLRRVPSLRRLLTAAEYTRMYRTLALLIHGGIALVPALGIVRGLLSHDLVPRLDGARQAVSEGQAFSDAMRAHALSTVIADRFIRVGEQTGKLAEMLDRAAQFHEEELARMADRVGRVLGPLMMLLMGIVIGFVVVMMYLPIFQLADGIG